MKPSQIVRSILFFSLLFFSCGTDEKPPMVEEKHVEELEEVIQIGDFKEGGIVFWVNSTYKDQGLVIALNDLSTSTTWGCYGTLVDGAQRRYIHGGVENTQEIIRDCEEDKIAARLCDNSEDRGYTDWYLPNYNEWAEILKNLDKIEKAIVAHGGEEFDGRYWSSTQSGGEWGKRFAHTVDLRYNKTPKLELQRKDYWLAVRAVRSF